MKKLLLAICALAAISLLAPAASFAQWENRIGMYTADAPLGGTDVLAPLRNEPFFIYFVLTNPTQRGAPATVVKGFEFLVTATGPATGMSRIGEYVPPNFIPVGSTSAWRNSMYIGAMGTAQPVTNGQYTMVSWEMMMTVESLASPFQFYLSPPTPATVPGKMAYITSDASGDEVGCVSSQPGSLTGDWSQPVFSIGMVTDPVSEESASFGSVKSLFR